jgi:hypothetical protein
MICFFFLLKGRNIQYGCFPDWIKDWLIGDWLIG